MLKNKSVVSIDDVSDEDILEVFRVSDQMAKLISEGKKSEILSSKIMATFFYEPSTRTRLSFESSMHRLGGSVISVSEASSSSVAKGETLADTIRMADAYSDVIVIRHPLEGSARLASKFSSKPVVNAGDGAGQHPTQTLLDMYTIRKEFGKLDGLKISLVGDLKYGRTVHSLIRALTRFDVEITLISPSVLKIPEHVMSRIPKSSKITVTESMDDHISNSDVFYVTRIQKERFTDQNEYRSVIGSYSIDGELVGKMKDNAILMHPLPRIDEIAPEVDYMPQAKYFNQAANGIPVRMALLSMILGGE